MKNNVILIGMPGAGKSTVGVVLAKLLNYKFVDSDIVIQQKMKKKLNELILGQGEEYFKKIENKINSGLNVKKCVVATGGSVVFGKEAMEHLKKIGTVVYLKVDFDSLEKRLGDLDKRGVVHKPGETLMDIFNERAPLYEKYADIIIDETNLEISQVARKIEAAIFRGYLSPKVMHHSKLEFMLPPKTKFPRRV
ncbi:MULTISPECIES: shikimate kinase [unclassified Treponema]|uniref:shikimate kinase n=1 Tax=unclassified Treponema TaxID=2638727 RepID=UPI000E9A706B|nr:MULTISPECIES: shikimate kinase [unclassified Treponema]HAZ97657.1 shikimate kinase [Treponema sp.]HBP10179.1 shikimate kinase [Treponema sp.]